MRKDKFTKFLPLVLVLITFILSISYFHESAVMAKVQDSIQSGLSGIERTESAQ